MSIAPISKPSSNDVLFGRGHQCQNHHGNLYFREAVNKCKVKYTQASRTAEKDAIAKQVFRSISKLNPPGRFIRKADDGKYYTSSDKDAMTKIKQALRENSKDIKDRMKTSQIAPSPTSGGKRPATTMLSRKSATKQPSVVTKDDMKKLATLILEMD